jgi:hypothetical protein
METSEKAYDVSTTAAVPAGSLQEVLGSCRNFWTAFPARHLHTASTSIITNVALSAHEGHVIRHATPNLLVVGSCFLRKKKPRDFACDN